MTERTISQGDVVEHDQYGEVTISGISERLDDILLTDTGDEVVFDGSTVVSAEVSFTTQDRETIIQSMEMFIENIDV